MDDSFEWDPTKRVSNFHKHGIDFLDVARIFTDPWRITLNVTKPTYRERRYQVIGMMDHGQIVTIVYTAVRAKCELFRQESQVEMSDKSTTNVRRLPDGATRSIQSMTNWATFDALTEEEITAAALSDPDNPLWTDEQLARGKYSMHPKAIRQRLKLTQEQFAERFKVPLGTLRDWEQGVTVPDSAAKNYLRVIAKNPQAVLDALEE